MYTLFITDVKTCRSYVTKEFETMQEAESYVHVVQEFREDVKYNIDRCSVFIRDSETCDLFEFEDNEFFQVKNSK